MILSCQKHGQTIAVPKYSKTGMIFVELKTPLPDLPLDNHGIRTETSNSEISNFDLIIVPGRAFTINGDRCGRGGGFYDKFLSQQACPKIALAFQEQIFEEIPMSEFDQTVDLVITPTFY